MSGEHRFDDEKLRIPSSAFRGMLGLSRRAGRVLAGTAQVCDAVRAARKPALVLIDADASEKTKSKLWGLCHAHGVPYLTLKADGLLGEMLGRGSEIVTCAVTDDAMAKRLCDLCTEPAASGNTDAAPQ